MKRNKTKKKLSLNKFQMVKLNNLNVIRGGGTNDIPTVNDTGTDDTKTKTSKNCNDIPDVSLGNDPK